MAEANGQTDVVTRGKVTEVCRQFLTSGDAGLAQRLQDEEYGKKHEWNREIRKVARVDVPMAKSEQDIEQERQQKERFAFLQQQSKLAEEDERVALQLQQEEQLHTNKARTSLTERDAEVALELQREEERRKALADHSVASNDAKIALEMQKEEILGKERNRIKRELEDQALAQSFQEEERRLAEMKTMERDLRAQRRALELELLHEVQLEEMTGQGPQRPLMNRDTVAFLSGGSGGYQLANVELLSEKERQEIMKLQDEELARALQEHEEKKARRARREIAADIEERDYQLARIMQEVEKLELAKRQYQEQGGTYIILPVTHVEPQSVPANNLTGSGPPVYLNVSRSTTQQNSAMNNSSVRLGSSSSSGASSSPQSSFPPTASPPPPPPPSASPAQPLSANHAASQRSNYSTVTHTRVTETRVTSQPHPTLNNQSGSRTPNQPAHYQETANQGNPPRRQSSRDKSCKQQ